MDKACALTVAAALAFSAAGAVDVSSGPLERGKWNSNLPEALAAAKAAHAPLLLVHSSDGCSICARLNKAIEGEAFRQWQKDRSLFMAYVKTDGEDSPGYREAKDLVKSIDKEVSGFPYVAVYWERPDGQTNSIAFSGRRGQMSEERNRLMSVEFMNALDGVLGDYLAGRPGSRTVQEIVSNSVRSVSFKTAGAPGSVQMRPETGVLPEGGTVSIEANPAKESVFVKWLDPAGNVAGYRKKIAVSGGMPAGEYTAMFRTSAECVPPEITVPDSPVGVRAGSAFSYQLQISEACRPVRLKTGRRLPRGFKFDEDNGRIYGKPKNPGLYAIDITAVGSDPARTVKRITVSVNVTTGG